MKIISHRGNFNGVNSDLENKPSYILATLDRGFDVEIDLWSVDGGLYLGHDEPQYLVSKKFLNERLWIHCKNLRAVETLHSTNLNWFWHQNDMLTITSNGYVWAKPGVYVGNSVVVMAGRPVPIEKDILGVCTDYPLEWLQYFYEQKKP